MAKRAEHSIGEKFGKLTIIGVLDKIHKNGARMVACVCDCGVLTAVNITYIRNGDKKSCGCLHKETASKIIKEVNKTNYSSGKWSTDPKLGSAKVIFKQTYNDGDLSFEEFYDLSQQNCYYCGKEPSNKMNTYAYQAAYDERKGIAPRNSSYSIDNGTFIYNGLDRMSNKKGHYKDDVVACCWDCNFAKVDLSYNDFLEMIYKIAARHPKK